MKNEEIIIDATDSVLGRLCSFAVKKALLGNKVVIVNCENAIILGNRKDILSDFSVKRARGGAKGPFYPTLPKDIVKRALRGMLKYKKGRGDAALRNLVCYGRMPEKYKDSKKLNIETKRTLKCLRLKEIGKK